MINILGYEIALPAGLEFLGTPGFAFAANMLAWIVLALLLNFVLLRILKIITRRLPGDLEDIVLSIIRRPILILLGLYGVDFSMRQLGLQPAVMEVAETLFLTIVVIVITHITGRFIKDVLVYYGERWAARTETHVDDVLIPVLNLFGPLLLVIIAALIILPMWGVNVTSVLLGAGVLGLILGLALQETLGNIFSGLSLLMESPFKKGDLVLLADGRVCEVMHLGMRSTMMFSLEDQATVYIPNKLLASSTLINMTKPTAEQRYSIDVSVNHLADLAVIENALVRIANGHPAILSSNMTAKLDVVKDQAAVIRQHAQSLPENAPAREDLLNEADKNERSLGKLELEGKFNTQVLALKEALRGLIRGINAREGHGLSEAERQELYCGFISPADQSIQGTIDAATAWVECRDPWLNDVDFWHQRKVWELRNEQLHLHWDRLKKCIYQPDDSRELRLDDSTKTLLEWLEREYKVPPGYWKNPSVNVTRLDNGVVQLQLCYYVDNIRLEHDSRPHRVRTEISRLIHTMLVENGFWK